MKVVQLFFLRLEKLKMTKGKSPDRQRAKIKSVLEENYKHRQDSGNDPVRQRQKLLLSHDRVILSNPLKTEEME